MDDGFEYPAPNIKWHGAALGVRSENPVGIAPPKAPPPPPVPAATANTKPRFLKVRVDTASHLSSPASGGTHRYCISAFYYNESPEAIERRRTEPQAPSPAARPGFDECRFDKLVRIPYNSRQQFVQVAVYLVTADGSKFVGDGEINPFVGEAHVPMADPRAETLSSWNLMRGGAIGEQTGTITVEIKLPGDDDEATQEKRIPGFPVGSEPTVGTAAEVFSRNNQRWELGRVTKVNGRVLVVEYASRVREVNLDDPEHLAAFRLVEDQAAAQNVLGIRPPGGGGEKRLYSLGEPIEVFSRSNNQWIEGRVAKLNEVEMVVEYGDRMRTINLQLEDYSVFVRPLARLPPPPPVQGTDAEGSVYRVGEAVEIYSQSARAWLIGSVMSVEGGMVVVEYQGSDGIRQKTINLQMENLALVLRPHRQSGISQGSECTEPSPTGGAVGSGTPPYATAPTPPGPYGAMPGMHPQLGMATAQQMGTALPAYTGAQPPAFTFNPHAALAPGAMVGNPTAPGAAAMMPGQAGMLRPAYGLAPAGYGGMQPAVAQHLGAAAHTYPVQGVQPQAATIYRR